MGDNENDDYDKRTDAFVTHKYAAARQIQVTRFATEAPVLEICNVKQFTAQDSCATT